MNFTLRERFSHFSPPSADLGSAHVLPVPRFHVRPAVDHLLRAGGRRAVAPEPEPDRVLIQRHPYGPGVLESGYSQHPPAHGPQQSGKSSPPVMSSTVFMSDYNRLCFHVRLSDGRDGLSACHQFDGSPAGMQLNHLCEGLIQL